MSFMEHHPDLNKYAKMSLSFLVYFTHPCWSSSAIAALYLKRGSPNSGLKGDPPDLTLEK